MIVLTKKDLNVQEPGPPAHEHPHIPQAIKNKLGSEYRPPSHQDVLGATGMAESGFVVEPATGAAQLKDDGPGDPKPGPQAIGRAVPVAWLLYQLSLRVAKGEWAIRMAAAEDGGIWIEGNSWNNDWPKIGTDP